MNPHRASAPFALAVLLLPGCRGGYYPTWHYAPRAQIHEIHLRTAGDPSPKPQELGTVAVTAQVVGILRPVEDQPRRFHVHFEILNRGSESATFDPDGATATPAGAQPLHADAVSGAAVPIASGERRSIEIYFPIPSPTELPNASLEEIDLGWTVDYHGIPLASHATFRRAVVYDDPYWHDPWGAPYYYGPGWGFRTGVTYVHGCD